MPLEYSVCTESTTQTSGRSASRVASTASRSVSATIGTRSASGPSRSARSFTCAADSSPDTYSTRCPAAARLPSAPPVIVDLPMPGAPPISTSEPGTSPPPSTRSNSPMRVLKRRIAGASTSERGTGRNGLAERRPSELAPEGEAVTTRSSVIVFHSSQPGQRPCHLALSCPHSAQMNTVVERAIHRG